MNMLLLTQHQQERAKRRAEVVAEYKRLAADPANSRSAIIQHLMKKYNIAAPSTVYDYIKKEKEAHNEDN